MRRDEGGGVVHFNDLQPKSTRNTPVVKQFGFLTFRGKGEHTPWRTVGHLSNRVLESTSGFQLVLEDYDLGSRALFSEVSNPG